MTKDDIFLKGIKEKYPEELLEGRLAIEGNCISSLFLDILLLDENNLKKEMFVTRDGRFYFNLLRHLRDKGINTVDEVSILSNCSDQVIEAFNDRGGYDAVDQMMSAVSLTNWDSFSDQLYRENLLMSLYNAGYNLLKEAEYAGKKIIPIQLFRKLTCESVLDFYEAQLSGFEVGQSSKILEEEEIDFNDKWIEGLKEGETVGTPYTDAGCDINGDTINCYQFLSKQTLGLHNGTLSVLSAFSSTGKSTWIVGLLMAQMHYGRKVLLISNEEDISRFRSKFLCWTLSRYCRYYKLSKSRLESGNINDEDRKQIAIAQKYWDENYKDKCYFVSMNCTDMKVVSKKVREYVLKKGVDLVVFDTFKLADDSMSGERTDLSLVRDSRELFNIARKYNIAVLATAQLAERFRGNLVLNASHLSGAKAIKEICSLLFCMRRVYQEELFPNSKIYLQPFQRKYVNGKWIEEEYQADPSESYAILFPDKNRYGNDSSNGEAYLLRFVGSQSVFKEVAYCRPKHGMIQ